jgi:uncharacterized protein YwqG
MSKTALVEFLSALKRPVHFPVAEAQDDIGAESRYFGRPWMEAGREWPLYKGEPMTFVLQLDLATVPEIPGLPRTGILSFFHAGDYDATGANSAVLIQDTTTDGGLRDAPDGVPTLPSSAITSWISRVETPHYINVDEILEEHGDESYLEEVLYITSDTFGIVKNTDGVEVDDTVVIEEDIPFYNQCFELDKLGGYPYWAQGDETPKDSQGNPMIMVFQHNYDRGPLGGLNGAESDDPCYGIGHIWYSPSTGETYYNWACD